MADPIAAATQQLGVGKEQVQVTEWFQKQLLAALSDPLFNVSKAFETWIIDRVAFSGLNVPIGQIVGYSLAAGQAAPKVDNVTAEAHTTSAVYAAPNVSGGAGPVLTDLSDGSYLVLFGGSGGGDFANNVTYHMGVSVNGSTPVDAESAEWGSDRGNTSGVMAVIAVLAAGGTSNVLTAVYRSSDGTDRGNVRYRWITAIKLAN